jgi:hypothetical protein
MKKSAALLASTVFVAISASAASAEKWDMPMAYPATNFHSENAAAFAKCVTDGTGGSLEIVTHPNGSLFGGNDIKRAVQTGQAPIGERLLSAHHNEEAVFGFDSVPFLATSFAEAKKLWKAQRPVLEKKLAAQGIMVLFAVPWGPQGIYAKKEINSIEDMKVLLARIPLGEVSTSMTINAPAAVMLAFYVVAAERQGVVHRLDAGTSGLLIVAKDDEAHLRLEALLAAREVARAYLALVRGEVEHEAFTVEAPLGRDRARIAGRRGSGVDAVTDLEVRERLPGATLLVARPRTGRTHQIRVHLRAVGHPILGDRAYGGGGDDARRLGLEHPFLHAWRLGFAHPVSGERIELEEPLPRDLERALDSARGTG